MKKALVFCNMQQYNFIVKLLNSLSIKEALLLESSRTESMINIFLRVINRYIATEKKPCDYDVGCILHRAEVHTIDAIGTSKNINITNLALRLGVTKSAVSQMIDKLIKKGLVTKTVLSKSDTEVALGLSAKGEKVFHGHREYHQKLYSYLEKVLADVPENGIEIFKKVMRQLETFLEES